MFHERTSSDMSIRGLNKIEIIKIFRCREESPTMNIRLFIPRKANKVNSFKKRELKKFLFIKEMAIANNPCGTFFEVCEKSDT